MDSPKRPTRVLPDKPVYRPLERFWPYADLPEQPTDEELATLHPALREALFGGAQRPFSICVEFPAFEGPDYAQAVEMARASDEYVEIKLGGVLRHRARFFPGERSLQLRELYELVAAVPGCEVLVADQPVPYAKELWLPLAWFLIP
jgi:hypothetical protein